MEKEIKKEKIDKRKQLIKLLGRANYNFLTSTYYIKSGDNGKIIILSGVELYFPAIVLMKQLGYDFIFARKKLDSYLIEAIFKKDEA